MRIHIAIALTALLSIAGASREESARSISEWLWPPPVDSYPSIQPAASPPAPAAVEPLVYTLQEEGRRRNDKRVGDHKISKGVSVSISISKDRNKNRPRPHDHDDDHHHDDDHEHEHEHEHAHEQDHHHHEPSGHNTPSPILVAAFKPTAFEPQKPVQVAVQDSNSAWGWGWIKGIMNRPTWGWGSGSGGSTYGTSSSAYDDSHHHHHDDDSHHHHHDDDESDIISVTYGKPPSNYAGPGLYNPFSGWLYPKPGEVPPHVHAQDSPTMSEVMVIRYPEFIKTIGRGISKMTNAVKNIGKGVSYSLTKGMTDVGAGIGSGVASIIPLEEVGNKYHNMGGHIFQKPAPVTSAPGANSVVYVDKYPSVQGPASDNSWFKYPSSWFSSGSESGSHSASHSDSHADSTSTVYVNKGANYYHSHPYEHV